MLNARSIGHSNAARPLQHPTVPEARHYDQIKDKIKIIQGKPVGRSR